MILSHCRPLKPRAVRASVANTSVNRGCFKDLYREHEAVKSDKTSDSSQDQKGAVSYMLTVRRVIVF